MWGAKILNRLKEFLEGYYQKSLLFLADIQMRAHANYAYTGYTISMT